MAEQAGACAPTTRGGPASCLDLTATASVATEPPSTAVEVNRKEVEPELAKAAPDLVQMNAAGKAPAKPEPKPRKGRPFPHGRRPAKVSLSEAVAVAVLSHPLMGAAAARVARANADVDYAGAAFKPTLTVGIGSGFAAEGNYLNRPKQFSHLYMPGSWRTDPAITFRQLIYDFGAAQEEVERNKALVDSEKLKLADQAEDVALRTVNAFLNLLEQREILDLADSTVASERKLADLVKLSEQAGNATAADVDRINTRIFEIEATRSEVDSTYHIAIDEFRRLTGFEPQNVERPPVSTHLAPKTADAAIAEAKAQSPQLLAIRAEGLAIEHQVKEQDAANKPQFNLLIASTVQHYLGVRPASTGTLDNRAMVVLDYKLFDGGARDAQMARIRAGQNENRFNELDQIESLELNIRRFYETLAANKIKVEVSRRGVVTAEKVNASFLEQFKSGKRTIFDVLDSYTSIYNIRKSQIEGEYEGLRAQYGVLRNLGRLNRAIVAP